MKVAEATMSQQTQCASNSVLIPVPWRESSVVMQVCFHSNPPSQAENRLSRFQKGKLNRLTTFRGGKHEENPKERIIHSKESTVDEE